MTTKYFLHGSLDDHTGPGLRALMVDDPQGDTSGYGVETDEATFYTILAATEVPDFVEYFPSINPPAVGVINREAWETARRNAQVLTPRQAREALIRMGKDEDADAAIGAIPDAVERKVVHNWYEYSQDWQYGHPLLTQFAAALSIDKDEFFALAKTL